MWFKLSAANFSANNLGTMSSISKSYKISTDNLIGLSVTPTSIPFETEGSSVTQTLTFTVKSGYKFTSGSTIKLNTSTIYTANSDIAAGGTFTANITINANASVSGTATVVSGGNTGGSEGDEPVTPPPSQPDTPVTGTTTWYVDHRANKAKFTQSVNKAGRGWCHVPGSAAYNAYVGKPVNTIGFFTDKASQSIVIGKVQEKGEESAMTVLATVTAKPDGNGFATITFPAVTLASGECLCAFTQASDDIDFKYAMTNVTDANGIVDSNFYGRVPKVYGSGTAWTQYAAQAICLGWSIGYTA